MTSSTVSSRGRPGSRLSDTGVPHLAHLGLDELRGYRQELIDEEAVISYWRRVVHARIDAGIVSNDAEGRERLRSVVSAQQNSRRRVAHLTTYDGSAPPPMPDLAVLWETRPDPDWLRRLAVVEAELSTYRRNLHERLDEATSELIARYREEPALALHALPGAGAA